VSAATALAATARRLPSAATAAPASPRAPRPVEVVTTRAQRRARPRAVYAVVSTAGVLAILLTQLLLSIALSDGAYRIAALQGEAVELDRSAQVLSESLETLRSPQNLAANAESLGMVTNASPAYLRLADATVLGAPVAADAGAGVLDGRAGTIGNVLLTDVPLVTSGPEGEANGVAATPPAPGSLTSPANGTAPEQPTTLPSPVTR
jgi:hypothetical protein